MLYTIKKNRHRACPLKFGIWYNKTNISKKVTFLSTYPFNRSVNKLFGIGYFWNHHKESARIGFRYEGSGYFKLYAYCYVIGSRITREICQVPINTEITCSIDITNNKYIFKVSYNSAPVSIVTVNFNHKKKWSFPLNLYYGGTNKAPNEIKVKIS